MIDLNSKNTVASLLVALSALAVTGCGKKQTELGQGSSEVTGSAGPAGAKDEAKSLVKCAAPVATLALLENPSGYTGIGSYNLPQSPVPLVRLLAQQSGCFRVVDRAGGLKGTIQEQQLKEAGILRSDGNTVQKGKGIEAQYTLTPSLTFSETNAGRSFAGLIGMIPVLRDIVGLVGLIEQVKFKEAQVALLLTDNETTEQLAAATGSVKVTDVGMGGLLAGGLGGVGGMGWSNTNEGKVITAAFLDAHNKLVTQVRDMQAREMPPVNPAMTRAAGAKPLGNK
jgi:curli biogenesis system outer membrane secretion channel CsgG